MKPPYLISLNELCRVYILTVLCYQYMMMLVYKHACAGLCSRIRAKKNSKFVLKVWQCLLYTLIFQINTERYNLWYYLKSLLESVPRYVFAVDYPFVMLWQCMSFHEITQSAINSWKLLNSLMVWHFAYYFRIVVCILIMSCRFLFHVVHNSLPNI